jgi:ATP-binding cassette subfamily B protein
MDDHELKEEEKFKRINLDLWRRILVHARPYRTPLAGLAVSGFVFALIDALLPRVTGLVIDEATTRGLGPGLLKQSIYYLGLVGLMAFLIWFFIVMAGRAATGFAYDMRRSGFGRLQELSFSFYDHRPVGWLMARLTSDCERVSSIIPWFMLDLVWGTTLILGISFMMLYLNWRLGLLVMLILPPLAFVSVIFQRKLLRSQRAVRRANSEITASFNEAIMGARTTKALVRERENLGEFMGLSSTMYRHSVRNALQAAVYLPLVISLGSIGVGLALWRGGLQIAGDMSLGVMVTFMQYAAFFYVPVQELAERFTQLQAAQAAAERIQGLIDTEPEIADAPGVPETMRRLRREGRINGQIRSLEFHQVSFSYKEGETVLDNFNVAVVPGETLALVGATGSGKTTIVSLLSRFYEPTAGTIRINGIDYRELSLSWLQSKLGIVLQSPYLFSGSIRENIRYGRLDATDDEIVRAAEIVNAHEFISEFEDKYDTDVGEGGGRLSTGQKQLIALARAILADPEIFILDEATSSVDTETERLIQDGIETVLKGRISFIIAHRLSTVRSADRILVIDSGRIIECGKHDELIQQKGRYYTLYSNQFTRETEERILADTMAS